jgi:outer membrane protein TolC
MSEVRNNSRRRKSSSIIPVAALFCFVGMGLRANSQAPQAPALSLDIPKSRNPFGPYLPTRVPAAGLANSPRIDQLIRDGKLYLSLDDAILLALENNLDIAIARYNLPIAEADVERTQAGGAFRGVNAGIVQNTPGGGVGGFGAGAPGAGAGGTTGGAGGAGSGASGIVQSTLGAGTAVSSYDPAISGTASVEHFTTPLSNLQIYGVPSLQVNTITANLAYTQAFPTGTALSFNLENSRVTGNSIYNYLNPALNVYYRIAVQQQLLAGFGLGPNLRYLRIAKNDRKISDIAFTDQVTATVTQIADMYWDLADAYQDVQVKERSLQFAKETLDSDKKQLELRAIPAMDVTKAGAEMENREQELTTAKTTLELQESLIKNALTKNLDDLVLEEIPVVPTEKMAVEADTAESSLEALTAQALRDRPELKESVIDLDNRDISRAAARNALLPSLALQAYYGGSGLAGVDNPASGYMSSAPVDYGSSFRKAFDNSSPDYLVGLSLRIPIRNRVLKSDQYRSDLEYRQSELRIQQLKKQVRIEVRNALYALQQSQARVASAKRGRDLAQQTFDISKQEQQLGSGSNFQTLLAQRDLALAESSLDTAETIYEKARVELDRAIGSTLESHNIAIDDAKQGVVVQSR